MNTVDIGYDMSFEVYELHWILYLQAVSCETFQNQIPIRDK